jgi:tRNA-dihydrouridine synthase 3
MVSPSCIARPARSRVIGFIVLLRETLQGALVMAPMTKGSNLPYRQLCQALGARVTMSEMTVARRLKQKRRSEFALIRRAADERFFGVQLAGNNPDEMAWAAQLVESRGADLLDLNLGCPIDFFTSKGLGAALAREPRRVRRVVEAMKRAVRLPVTVKIRLGWNDEHRNYLDVARSAVDGGADAVFVHGRTRAARYTMSADWQAIGEVAAAVPVPVIGNGDLLFRHDIDAAFGSACTAVMTARGALIKPWLFREAIEGDLDPSGDERLDIYRRYVSLAKAHWGEDAHGIARIREFLLWHLGFWCRYAPRRPDGSYPAMQRRESWSPRTPLEALLARSDAPAHEFLADRLLSGEPVDPAAAPAPAAAREIDDDKAEAG